MVKSKFPEVGLDVQLKKAANRQPLVNT